MRVCTATITVAFSLLMNAVLTHYCTCCIEQFTAPQAVQMRQKRPFRTEKKEINSAMHVCTNVGVLEVVWVLGSRREFELACFIMFVQTYTHRCWWVSRTKSIFDGEIFSAVACIVCFANYKQIRFLSDGICTILIFIWISEHKNRFHLHKKCRKDINALIKQWNISICINGMHWIWNRWM